LSRRAPLGVVLFFALAAVALLVAVLVVRARTPDLALEVTTLTREFSPLREELPDEARIEFFVRESDPAASVSILDPEGELVRTLAASVALEAGRRVSYSWDGRRDDGRLARGGRYRLRVVLPGPDRDMVWPRRMTLRLPPNPNTPPNPSAGETRP
jgi:hypothetical protein